MLRRRQPKPRNRLPLAILGKLSELKLDNRFAPFLFAYSTISFAQDLKWLLGCTRSTIPTAIFSLCTKPTALSAKIKRNKICTICRNLAPLDFKLYV